MKIGHGGQIAAPIRPKDPGGLRILGLTAGSCQESFGPEARGGMVMIGLGREARILVRGPGPYALALSSTGR